MQPLRGIVVVAVEQAVAAEPKASSPRPSPRQRIAGARHDPFFAETPDVLLAVAPSRAAAASA